MNPIVSVIIPAYNREAYIGEAIESALSQETEYPFEVIVSDDCSSDRTVAVARSFGDRVRVLTSPSNQGASASRNRAIRASRGEFLVLLDDDDRMLPRRIQAQVGFLVAHPNVGLAVGLCDFESGEWPAEQYFADRGVVIPWGEWRVIEDWRSILIRYFVGAPSATTIRRTFIDQVGYYDESIVAAEDVEFLMRASSLTPIACFNLPVCWRRTSHTHRATTSSRLAIRLPETYVKLLQEAKDLAPEERDILESSYAWSVRNGLGGAMQVGTRQEARELLCQHGRVLKPTDQYKWSVITRLPWPLMKRLATARGKVGN